MSHARIEEVSDSDLEPSDPSEADIEDFADTDIIRRRVVDPKTVTPSQSNVGSAPSASSSRAPGQQQQQQQQQQPQDGNFHTTTDAKQYADYHCLYPVYFDATRTRAEGRRVASHLAVRNPLAREIVNACAALRLPTLFEPAKSHPKDWGNPGRVKVRIPSDAAKGRSPAAAPTRPVENKHHLYLLVAEHLRANPVKEDSLVLRARIQGVPPAIPPGKPWPRPAVPRGWKIPELVPYISPAMSGGGVSENLFKDIMKEMQGDPMAAIMGGPGGPAGALEEKEKGGKKKKGKGKA
ncbi:signal recognition particle, SRP19 subunit [Sodiomyces alkalinus F11]|uniref:Signal recognition particle, SRP19 subunit n=1 Tax=Sodiomyces alkalinus (strain CBS 110278 / VKM F-3762 / F11) TaxID=1314773 RepID=A0A3N2Q724_SODAK|nr:signal recognition particle, SRP19 subunit [Sodiomyces alkalinus F11]ROT42487.1 signal recognition particle, SRP19 subunit [Sodiomyces alkalinus F11]